MDWCRSRSSLTRYIPWHSREQIQFTGVVQLTTDGAEKRGLVTDGRTLYFGEHQNSKIVLAAMSTEGGPIRTISTPFVQAVPVDISPDGKQLLVLVGEGIEVERALWIVPIAGGNPCKLAKSAATLQRGPLTDAESHLPLKTQSICRPTKGNSFRKSKLSTLLPSILRWAPNERSLRVNLRDRKSEMSSLWDLTFSDQDNAQVSSLVPLQVSLKDCWGNSMTLDGDGRSILAGGECTKERIYLLEKRHEPWSPHFDLVPTSTLIQSPEDLALDPKSKKVFALGDSAGPENSTGTQRLELLRFDARSNEFRPFLPGISATDVDFSRDGNGSHTFGDRIRLCGSAEPMALLPVKWSFRRDSSSYLVGPLMAGGSHSWPYFLESPGESSQFHPAAESRARPSWEQIIRAPPLGRRMESG